MKNQSNIVSPFWIALLLAYMTCICVMKAAPVRDVIKSDLCARHAENFSIISWISLSQRSTASATDGWKIATIKKSYGTMVLMEMEEHFALQECRV